MTVVEMPDPAVEPTVDVERAAALLGVGRNTAYESIRAGNFPVRTFRVGRRLRCVSADLLRFLDLTPTQHDEA